MAQENTTARRPRSKEGQEVWETTTGAEVWLNITVAGREKLQSVGGTPGSRLRISTVDREINQDAVNGEDDPFRNGLLKRVDADQQDDPATASDQVFTTAELLEAFRLSGAPFRLFVDKLSELNARRMREMAESADATASQTSYLNDVVSKFVKHGSMPSYDELKGSGEVKG